MKSNLLYITLAGLASHQAFTAKFKPRVAGQLSESKTFRCTTIGLLEHAITITSTTCFSLGMFFTAVILKILTTFTGLHVPAHTDLSCPQSGLLKEQMH